MTVHVQFNISNDTLYISSLYILVAVVGMRGCVCATISTSNMRMIIGEGYDNMMSSVLLLLLFCQFLY